MVRSRPSSRGASRDRSPNDETARLRAEVKDLLKEKQHTQHQLDRIHEVLDQERKALKEVLAAARQAVDDLKVENLGLTQALATERNARIKDREAYTAQLQQAHERPNSVERDGSFDELVWGVREMIEQLQGPEPNLRDVPVGASSEVRPVLTAVRACFANVVRKKELAEATLDSETINYEMRLLDLEARMSSESAAHLEAIDDLRRSQQGRGSQSPDREDSAQKIQALERSLAAMRVERDTALAGRGSVGLKGFLLKKGESTDIWRQRWVEIDGQNLKLYDPDERKPKNVIPLTKITKISKSSKRQNAFVLEIPGKGMVHLDSERPENRQQWLKSLQLAHSIASGSSPPPESPTSPTSGGGMPSPREMSLEKSNTELMQQAAEDRDARSEMGKRLNQVEDAFDKLAALLMHLEQGNWEHVRKEVRMQLAELGLLGHDEVDETPRSDMLTPTDHEQDPNAIRF